CAREIYDGYYWYFDVW
nr:immunoglobulin heavy chain junction region [Mus musculus]MBK4189331.1 immunoglobulin heavy chain junction region [Mus musculus]MBK4189332.1 immunoglobulin heavy chain junction region [Mus musculus]